MKLRSCVSLSLLLIFFTLTGYAQKTPVVYLKAGVNLANVTTTDDGRFSDNNMLTTWQAGLLLDIPVVKMFSIQTGASYTGKGSKVQNGDPETDLTWYKATSNPFYIQVPLNFVLKVPGQKAGFFIGVGPYIAVGVSGKNKVEGELAGSTFSSDDKIRFSDDDPTTLNYEEGAGFGIMRRFDHGFNGTIGINCKKVFLSANYELGLAKLQSGSNNSTDDRNKHRVLSFTLGYRLSK